GGSAGIQADLKTFQEFQTYGMRVVTAIVSLHPETKKNIHPQTIKAIEAQCATAMRQVRTDVLRTGMLFSIALIERVAELIAETMQDEQLVVDPVMVGKLDPKLLEDDAIKALRDRLIPQATIITPNMPEAEILLDGKRLETIQDLKQAAID